MIEKLFLTTALLTVFFMLATLVALIIANNSKSDLADWAFAVSFTLVCILPFVSLSLLIVKLWV